MTTRSEKAARIRRLLETEGDAVEANTQGFNRGRYESVAGLEDYEGLKARAREIKVDAIDRLPELIDELRETVESAGGNVYIADDQADAQSYVQAVARERDADLVAKSKSMTSEEIEFNDALFDVGVDVLETDLGEWVLQIADESPSHIVAPAIHKSREDIAALFTERFDPAEPLETPEDLTRFARDRIGERIARADVGMTGANFIAANSGTIALVTSEGNARKTIASTDTHVVVAGIEKIVPSVEEFRPFVELIARSGTGQDITSYVSLFTPPVDAPVVDPDRGDERLSETATEREFHLVLIDNGRTDIRGDDDLEETLYCIRCSACSNSCANFQQVGGHAFGGETYSGGIATGWETAVHGLDSAAEFNDLCTGCTRCVNACPVGIDIPWINVVVRDRLNDGHGVPTDTLVDGLTPDAESDGSPDLQKRLFGNFETLAKLGSTFAPLSNWVANSTLGSVALGRVAGVTRERDLPEFQRTTLVEWAENRDAAPPVDPDRKAVLYPDVYTNHVLVERGKAAIRALEALGVEVSLVEAPGSGRAPLSQGMIDTARTKARGVSAALEPYLDEGYDIVVIEPSDLAMFREDYGRLLSEAEADRIAEHSYEILEYIFGLVANGAEVDRLATPSDVETVAYHSHCQQRTMGIEPYSTDVLEKCGYEVTTSDVECCGMAGSFGYKQQYYELSMDVGEQLAEQLRSAEADHVVASGTSCTDQIGDILGDEPKHVVELLDPTRSD